jgi:GTP-binding protein
MEGNLQPLFEMIEKYIPCPIQKDEKLRFLITNLDYSDFLGRIAIGRMFSGDLKTGMQVVSCNGDKITPPMKVTKIFKFDGLNRVETDSVTFGDIIAVSGFTDDVTIGTTICDVKDPDPIAYVKIDEPTLSMYFGVNTSPFCGKEGSILSSRQIRERLFKELKINVALRVDETSSPEVFKVSGRGQLHLAVLIENMRREGFELQVSAPEVIYKDVNGKKCEPFEILVVDVDAQYQGTVMAMLGTRRALLENVLPYSNKIRMEFKIPSRGLLGLRGNFLTETRGTGLLNSRYLGYEPFAGDIPSRTRGALVSMEAGKTTAYALDGLKDRGVLFIEPGLTVYEGMVIGEHTRDNDLEVNPAKEKKLTNMRASGTDDAVKLAPPKSMDLERSLDWIRPDELLEVTPVSLRIRKKYLKAGERKKHS